MSEMTATALVADDEPLLRDELVALLARTWPGLQVVAQARNGREAVELFEQHQPQVCFLDVHMPGMTGIEAAQARRELAQQFFRHGAHLRWIRASSRGALRMIPVDDIDFLRSDEKYTLVAWRDEGQPAEALISTPLKSLVPQLDAEQFVQIHRSVVVNLRSVRQVVRGENETAIVHLKDRGEQLPVSRSYLHVFRQM